MPETVIDFENNPTENTSVTEMTVTPASRGASTPSASKGSMEGMHPYQVVDIWGMFFNFSSCDIWTDKNKVYFVGDVTEDSVNTLIKTFRAMVAYYEQLERETNTAMERNVEFYISSNGGSVIHGFRLIDFLETLDLKIKTVATGNVASMGFMLWLIGEERYMMRHAHLLIHQLSTGIQGKRGDIIDYFKHMEDLHNQILMYIIDRTGLRQSVAEELMNKETWLVPSEAVTLKLCKIYTTKNDKIAEEEVPAKK